MEKQKIAATIAALSPYVIGEPLPSSLEEGHLQGQAIALLRFVAGFGWENATETYPELMSRVTTHRFRLRCVASFQCNRLGVDYDTAARLYWNSAAAEGLGGADQRKALQEFALKRCEAELYVLEEHRDLDGLNGVKRNTIRSIQGFLRERNRGVGKGPRPAELKRFAAKMLVNAVKLCELHHPHQ